MDNSQLRTNKTSFISEDMWLKIHDRIMCGLSFEKINEKGGCNVNKLLAYIALSNSATDSWDDFDIDRVIVIPDWEGPVTGDMLYIKPDYTTERGIRTVMINHVDGCGMILPSASDRNFMTRGPFVKGLLIVWDFIRFCKENSVEAVIEDLWGVKHDLIKENIQVILTKSMFKMWKYYKNFEEYKYFFKLYGCHFGKTNYEEDYIPDKQMNYQFIQNIGGLTDEEIQQFTARSHTRLENLAKDKNSMLQTLKASATSPNPYCKSLAIYPELLRDYYSRQQLKDIKKKMLYDARSGAIKCENKRLFVIPDLYAACEYYFLHKERPDGLLNNGEIACKPYRSRGKADVLRSPSLYAEHAVRKIVDDPKVYEWFTTNAIVTSSKDLISRILQFDVDGDQLNVVVEDIIVNAAERNNKKYDIVPLFYDAAKAKDEIVNKEMIFLGLKRAHDYSNIGEISNMLTCLWNRNKPDVYSAALLAALNNWRID